MINTYAIRWLVPAVAALGAFLVASPPVHADPTVIASPSYQLGYNRAVLDGRGTANRMRQMGLPESSIVISNQIPDLCARELGSVQTMQGLNGPDFLRGCADGMQSLVAAGVAH